eukprot:CAMPEP_0117443690 /NCGR_PEP_ID=MMETSP0759-20121206/4832_1 /TAXON_ID=63605 /ORGANISM="Percolomonas cosmopolitus, Strain WS" /LENGTH=676 /DNA_ID=CAMNT_0005235687 /DNA_START=751 /DNA_END=2781 /DNA_ORIENTATION=+
MLLEAFHPVVRKDKEIVATAVLNAPEALIFASQDLRMDSDFAVKLVSVKGEILAHVHPSKQKEHQVVWHAVRQNGLALRHAHHSLKKDIRIALHALKSHPGAIEYVSPVLTSNRAFIKWALEANGHTMKHLEDAFKKDPEMMKLALSKAPETLDYLNISLESDHLLIVECIKTHGTTFLKTHPQFLRHKLIALEALKRNGLLLSCMDIDAKRDPELVLCAVRQNGWAIVYADETFLADKIAVEAALRNDPTVLSLVHKDLRTNKKLIIIAVAQRGKEIRHAHDDLKKDKQVGLLAIRQDAEAFHHLHDSLKTNVDFLREALSINKEIAAFIEVPDPEVLAMKKGALHQVKFEQEERLGITSVKDTEHETHVPALIEDHSTTVEEHKPEGGVIEETITENHMEPLAHITKTTETKVSSTPQCDASVCKKGKTVVREHSPSGGHVRTITKVTKTPKSKIVASVLRESRKPDFTENVDKIEEVTRKLPQVPPSRLSLKSHATTDDIVSVIDDIASEASIQPRPTQSENGCSSTTLNRDKRAASLATLIKKNPPNIPKRHSSKHASLILSHPEKQVETVGKRPLPVPKQQGEEPHIATTKAMSRLDRSTLNLRRKLTKENRHAHSTNRLSILQRRLGEVNAPKVTVNTSRKSSRRRRSSKKADSAVPLKTKPKEESVGVV